MCTALCVWAVVPMNVALSQESVRAFCYSPAGMGVHNLIHMSHAAAQSSAGLLRERGAVQGANSAVRARAQKHSLLGGSAGSLCAIWARVLTASASTSGGTRAASTCEVCCKSDDACQQERDTAVTVTGSCYLPATHKGIRPALHTAAASLQQTPAPLCAQLDDVMGTAQAVAGGLGEQRRLFDRIGSRLEDVGARFPLVNSLLGAIRRKRSKARACCQTSCPMRACLLLPHRQHGRAPAGLANVCRQTGLQTSAA